ncbi:hypothetical protein FHX15_004676 [Rhizobium sp. BK650]|nr:hypothetical protein [Rhizobium sp. BK650]
MQQFERHYPQPLPLSEAEQTELDGLESAHAPLKSCSRRAKRRGMRRSGPQPWRLGWRHSESGRGLRFSFHRHGGSADLHRSLWTPADRAGPDPAGGKGNGAPRLASISLSSNPGLRTSNCCPAGHRLVCLVGF